MHPKALHKVCPPHTRAARIATACLLVCVTLSFLLPQAQAQASSPHFVSARTNANDVIVTFSEDIFIHPMVKYVHDQFNANPYLYASLEVFMRAVMSVTIDGKKDFLLLASLSGNELTLRVTSPPGINSGEKVEVAYNNIFAVNAMGFGGLFIDADGNPVPTFSAQTVTNNNSASGDGDIVAGPEISKDHMTISENGRGTYTVALAEQPSEEKTVNLLIVPESAVQTTPTSLTFTQDNWDDPQTVTVTAVEDNDSIDAWAVILNQIDGVTTNRSATFLRVLVEDQDDPLTVSGNKSTDYAENGTSSVATYSVADAGTSDITWSVFGQDKDDFSISNAGVLAFKTPPDYESPADSGRDNVYHVTIEARDGSSSGVLLGVAINVTNVYEPPPVPTVSVTPATLSVDEGAGSATLTVELSNAYSDTVTVDWETSPGTADAEDYTENSGKLSFEEGETQKTISIPISDDAVDEGDETFTVTLSDAVSAKLGAARSTVKIIDDDTVGVSVSPQVLQVNEGGSAAYKVMLESEPTTNVNVAITVSPSSGDVSVNKSSLAFTPTNWHRAQTVTVTADEDGDTDADRAVLSHTPTGGDYDGVTAPSVSVAVLEDDTSLVSLAKTALDVPENAGSARLTVELSAAHSDTVTVDWDTSPGTADDGEDYNANPETLSFAPSETRKTINIPLSNDAVDEGDETFTVTLSSAVSAKLGAARSTVKIIDDDTAGVSVSPQVLQVNEGDSETYRVLLESEPTANVNVAITVDSPDGDVSADKSSLTFTPENWDMWQTVRVTADEDGDTDADRAVLSHTPTGGDYDGVAAPSVSVAVLEDDTSLVSLSQTALDVPENAGSARLTVELSAAHSDRVTVDWETSPGTADAEDYTENSGKLSFGEGETQKTISVPISDDAIDEEDETFTVTLLGVINAELGADQTAVKIIDDDTAGISVSPQVLQVNEGDSETYRVVLESEPTEDVNMEIKVSPSSGDVSVDESSLIFTQENWDTRQTVTVTVDQDEDTDADRAILSHTPTGGDYDGVTAPSVSVLVLEDDTLTDTGSIPEDVTEDTPEEVNSDEWKALLALYNATDGENWKYATNWMTAEPLDTWYGVITDDQGQVSELNLADNGLTGVLTDALESLRYLEQLDLSDNAELDGVLPLGLMELPDLEMMDVENTGVCAPRNEAFQRWLADISFHGEVCVKDVDKDELEQLSDGGGCAVSYRGRTKNASQGTVVDSLLAVCALVVISWLRNCSLKKSL